MLRRIASASMEQLGAFLTSSDVVPVAAASSVTPVALLGQSDTSPEAAGIYRIFRAEADPAMRMKMSKSDLPTVKIRAKGPRYTPVSKRGDKPDAIAYVLKNNPDIKDSKICKLLGTTKPTINSVRDRTHPNAQNIRPRHPAEVGLCTYAEYETVANKALKAAGKDPEKIKADRERAAQEQEKAREETNPMSAGFDFSNFLSGGKQGG